MCLLVAVGAHYLASILEPHQAITVRAKAAPSCPTLCDSMDSIVHGIL